MWACVFVRVSLCIGVWCICRQEKCLFIGWRNQCLLHWIDDQCMHARSHPVRVNGVYDYYMYDDRRSGCPSNNRSSGISTLTGPHSNKLIVIVLSRPFGLHRVHQQIGQQVLRLTLVFWSVLEIMAYFLPVCLSWHFPTYEMLSDYYLWLESRLKYDLIVKYRHRLSLFKNSIVHLFRTIQFPNNRLLLPCTEPIAFE